MTLLESVAVKISESNQTISDTVVNLLVQVEVERRVQIVVDAIKKLSELEKLFKRTNRPDVKNYDASGNEITFFSENRKKDITKQSETLEKLKALVETCLSKNTEEDYKKLKEFHDKLGANKESNKSESE